MLQIMRNHIFENQSETENIWNLNIQTGLHQKGKDVPKVKGLMPGFANEDLKKKKNIWWRNQNELKFKNRCCKDKRAIYLLVKLMSQACKTEHGISQGYSQKQTACLPVFQILVTPLDRGGLGKESFPHELGCWRWNLYSLFFPRILHLSTFPFPFVFL